jgi:hypothetical protein
MDWNNIIGISGALIGGAGIVVTYITQRKIKSFSYAVTDTPIISFNKKIEDVAVTYKGKQVENLRLVMVRVWNSGNVEIKEEDFKVPISFCPEQTARGNSLVVAQIVEAPEASNAELYPHEVAHHSYRTALKSMLFNPGDSVTVKIVIADYGGENLEANVMGRIVGVKSLKKEPYNINPIPPILRPFLELVSK